MALKDYKNILTLQLLVLQPTRHIPLTGFTATDAASFNEATNDATSANIYATLDFAWQGVRSR